MTETLPAITTFIISVEYFFNINNMKKHLALIVIVIGALLYGYGLTSCVVASPEDTTISNETTEVLHHTTKFRKVVLEEHEYWYRYGSYAGGLEHSASCPCHD
jgi:hypothetical protein